MCHPVLWRRGALGGAGQLITGCAEEVAPDFVLQRPLALVRHVDLKHRPWLFVFGLARDVAEAVHGEVFAQVGPEIDAQSVGGTDGLQDPHLRTWERNIGLQLLTTVFYRRCIYISQNMNKKCQLYGLHSVLL